MCEGQSCLFVCQSVTTLVTILVVCESNMQYRLSSDVPYFTKSALIKKVDFYLLIATHFASAGRRYTDNFYRSPIEHLVCLVMGLKQQWGTL